MTQRLTDEQVRHVAKLSRLRLTEAEVSHFAQKLSQVLGYVSKLEELDVTNVQPMAHAMDNTNALREDEPRPGLAIDQVLANAPDADPPFFKVPKVLGEGSGA